MICLFQRYVHLIRQIIQVSQSKVIRERMAGYFLYDLHYCLITGKNLDSTLGAVWRDFTEKLG